MAGAVARVFTLHCSGEFTMRKLLVLALVLGLVGVAAANDLGNQAPVKSPVSYPVNVPSGERQGGDTIANALLIPSFPYTDNGTTAGRVDDYDEVCPYDGSTSPDVVYRFAPTTTVVATLDLCNSSFDTKLYIYDAALNLIACNDDFNVAPCYVYSSKLESVTFNAGNTYYIIIDGYGGASGAYVLAITPPPPPCVVECPAGSGLEGEPALVNEYVDNHNGGCNTDPGTPFQVLEAAPGTTSLTMCGVSGWYTAGGLQSRDTDWFILSMGTAGAIDISIISEQPTTIYELFPQDCVNVDAPTAATTVPCVEGFMTITGYASGSPVWFWVGPSTYAPPAGAGPEYDYVVSFDGLTYTPPVATQSTTWGSMKALFE
jgi:hypothetical protein